MKMVETLIEQTAWLTPTYLFLLLNVVIATILLSSAFTNHNQKPPHADEADSSTAAPPPLNPPQLLRAPSLFSRVTSFNLTGRANEPDPDHNLHPQLHHNYSSPSLYSRVTSFKLSGRGDEPELDEGVARESKEKVEPEAKQKQKPKERTMTRSLSLLSRVRSLPIGRRAQQMEVGEVDTNREDGVEEEKKSKKKEDEVDAKADDFINKFKQQLKLQRLESLIRNSTA